MLDIPQIGIGLQFNPHILSWFPFEEQSVDAYEILLDSIGGAIDGPYQLLPGIEHRLDQLRARAVLIAHSNYGGEFGFGPLEDTAAVRRHVPLAQWLDSPWVADHCFYAEHSRAEIWSCPVQFSPAEVERLGERARVLQELYDMPLAHENAAYYFPFPGSTMPEAEFLARLVERAGTWLHLDLHNVYTNSVNLPGYRAEDFLATIPLDRVIAIHLAGGSYSRGVYHDWHDSKVPEPVWDMLGQVLRATRVGVVTLEFQGRAHHGDTRELNPEEDLAMITADLERARAVWDGIYGPGSRHSTREHSSADTEEKREAI